MYAIRSYYSSREDIAAPAEFVFDQLADFAAFEGLAADRGATITRRDKRDTPGRGMKWDVDFSFRGKPRAVAAEVVRYERSYNFV